MLVDCLGHERPRPAMLRLRRWLGSSDSSAALDPSPETAAAVGGEGYGYRGM